MPLVVGAASATAAAFSIDNSCRFNDDDSAMLEITPASTSDAIRKTWTFSVWFKIGNLGAQASDRTILFPREDGSNYSYLSLKSDDTLRFNTYRSGDQFNFITTQVFRDTGAWYHFVAAMDTTQAVEADRTKIYINGTQITDFSTETYPAQDAVTMYNSDSLTRIGNDDGSTYFDGYFAQIAMVTASQLAPTSFGEFNSDSPTIWQPIDISGLTFGTNGYFLDFVDSADFGNDVSGNNNDWTSSGLAAEDQATDTPTNNFSTANSLNNYYSAATFTEGNLHMVMSSSAYAWTTGTVGLSAGKWYWETKVITAASSNYMLIGASPFVSEISSRELGGLDDTCFGYYAFNGNIRENQVNTAYGNTYTTNDVIGTYLDVDNSKIYFAKNGTIQNSGTGYDITAAASTTTGYWLPAWSQYFTGATFAANFGNPTYTLTSAVADPNGYGSFEYSPNDGGSASFDGSAKDFLAICTKNLGSDGG